jgi:hypothetical protein
VNQPRPPQVNIQEKII